MNDVVKNSRVNNTTDDKGRVTINNAAISTKKGIIINKDFYLSLTHFYFYTGVHES